MNPNAPSAVVVTGASSGIGLATAALLAAKGFVVYAGVRSDEAAAKVSASGSRIRPLPLDVTDATSIAAAAGAIDPQLRLAGVVNNAGIAVAGPLEHLSPDEIREQFEINVIGPLAVTQAFLPRLRAARGRVVFVGSISGRFAVPFIAPYSASKFALRALSDAMRIELAPAGISVSLVEPGSVKTPIWQKGREAHRLLWERLSEQARSTYAVAMHAVVRQAEREERGGIGPEAVARTILHALSSRRPRAHYLIGTPARMRSIIVTLLPTRLHDHFIRKAMRLP
jgi:NAD(P)-dependent dehydrogenase (short-subunit alcohol dehydrogenase family)